MSFIIFSRMIYFFSCCRHSNSVFNQLYAQEKRKKLHYSLVMACSTLCVRYAEEAQTGEPKKGTLNAGSQRLLFSEAADRMEVWDPLTEPSSLSGR